MLLDTTSQGASAPTTKGESRMEERKKIAPIPPKKASRTRVAYDALDMLGGRATKKQLFAQTKLIWSQYRNDKPPYSLAEFNRTLLTSVSQGYLNRLSIGKGVNLNCEFEISNYERFAQRQTTMIVARAVYTLARVENGEQIVSEKTRRKLEATIDDPESFLPSPRILGQEKKPEPIKPQPELSAPTNMEELLAAAEKIVARQQPSPHNQPVTKIEIPIVSAIVGIGIAGLVLGAVICLGIIALSL
jgi:hypothetical protein